MDTNKSTNTSHKDLKTSKKRGVTRESLLDAGLLLFSENGFDGTSVKAVEAAVGLTPGSGSFYRHFKSKEALLESVVHREVENVRQQRDAQSRAINTSPQDRRTELTEQLSASLAGLKKIKLLVNLLGREYGRFPELMKQLRELLIDESLEFSTQDFSLDIDSGIIHSDDPSALSCVVLSALVGFHLSSNYFNKNPGGIENDRFIKALVNLILNENNK